MNIEFFTKCPECGCEIANGRKETNDVYLEIICPDCKYSFTSTGLSVSAEHTRQYDDVVQQTTVKYFVKNHQQLYSLDLFKTIPTPQILFPDEATLWTMFSMSVEDEDQANNNEDKAS